MTKHRGFLHKFFTDKNGKVAVWQRPNAPLTVWIIFTVLGRIMPAGRPDDIAHAIAKLAIIIWAALEVYGGVSYFRRTLGAVVLGFTIFSLL